MAIYHYKFGIGDTAPFVLKYDTDTNLYTVQWYDSAAGAYKNVLQIKGNTKEIKVFPTSKVDIAINKDAPKITLKGTETDAKTLSIREKAGVSQIYDEDTTAVIAEITPNLHLIRDTPKIRLEGTEASGIETQIKEDAGASIIRDETNKVDLLKLAAGTPIEFDIAFPAIFESIKSVDATAVGNKEDTQPIIPAILHYAKDVAIEASWTGAANTATKIGVYDDTDKAYICSVEAQSGTNEKSAYAELKKDHPIFVRAEVTTAASGASTDVTKAVVYVKVKIS